MSDAADEAQEFEQMRRDIALRKRKPACAYTGVCYNCEAGIDSGLFCDSDCRKDFEQRSKLKGIAGHE